MCDIGAPNIHRFPRVDGLSTGPPGIGASQVQVENLEIFYISEDETISPLYSSHKI